MVNLKGEWNDFTPYSQGDVVRYSDNKFYIALKDVQGYPCADSLRWNPLPSPLSECAKMCMDVMDSLSAVMESLSERIPANISDEAITLKTETAEYLITVDDSGDTPELAVTAIEEEEGEE